MALDNFHIGHAHAVTNAAFRKLDTLDFDQGFWAYCHGHGAMKTDNGVKFVFHLKYDMPTKILKQFEKLRSIKFPWFYEGETGEAAFDYELRSIAVAGGLTRWESFKRRILILFYGLKHKLER